MQKKNLKIKKHTCFLLLATLLLSSFIKTAYANSVVCMQTISGDFCLELYDDITPITVVNFLNYVNDGDYNNTIFHRSIPGFILQGGGYSINDELVLNTVPSDSAIINEFQLSNTRGTIAMAKVADNPDSATNQWFINLADNSANLDNQNGGFTVFGRVLDNGMDVIDSIASLQRYNFGGVLTDTPTVNYADDVEIGQDNFVFLENAEQLIEDESSATFQSNYIIAVIDAGSLGVFNCKLKLTETSPSYKFALDLSLVIPSPIHSTIQATLNLSNGLLTIPSIKLSETNIVENVILLLIDSTKYIFSLQSIDGQTY